MFGSEKPLLMAFPSPTQDQSLVQAFLIPTRAGSGLISCLHTILPSLFLPDFVPISLNLPSIDSSLTDSSQGSGGSFEQLTGFSLFFK